MFYDKDADLGLLSGKTIGIVGFGSQGHAHAQNLRDSGCNIIVAEAKGSKAWQEAQKVGMKVGIASEVAKEADILTLLVPDTLHPIVYKQMEDSLTSGKMLMFAHGFNIHYNQIVPPSDIDVTMVAPKCPGICFVKLIPRALGRQRLSLFTKMLPEKQRILPWPMLKGLAAPEPVSLRQHSLKRPKQIYSASRSCFVEVLPVWLKLRLKRSSRLATSLRSPISNACTSLNSS